jgi:hypothetical protein
MSRRRREPTTVECWTCGQWVAPGALHSYSGDMVGRGAIPTHVQRDATPEEVAERDARLLRQAQHEARTAEAVVAPALDPGAWHNHD